MARISSRAKVHRRCQHQSTGERNSNLTGKISTGEMAHSRISDTDVALESSRYAAQQVRTQASMAILAQGQKLNVGIPDLLRGVMVGRS